MPTFGGADRLAGYSRMSREIEFECHSIAYTYRRTLHSSNHAVPSYVYVAGYQELRLIAVVWFVVAIQLLSVSLYHIYTSLLSACHLHLCTLLHFISK